MTRKQGLAMRIKDAPLSPRTRNCLMSELGRQATVADLIERTPEQLLALPNFGKTSLMEVMLWLSRYRLRLYTPIETTDDTATIGRIAK